MPSSSSTAAFTPGFATVAVTSSPDAADIYIDGIFSGNTLANLKLPAGKHAIRILLSGYKDWSRDITVQAGSETRTVAALDKNGKGNGGIFKNGFGIVPSG